MIPDRHDDEVDPEEREDPDVSRDGSGEDDLVHGGVKEDFFELTQSLLQQFRGIVAFLAPPPTFFSDPTSPGHDEPEVLSDFPSIEGPQSDLAEIGGRFSSRISWLSQSKAVTEIFKIASPFIPFGPGEEDDEGLEGKYRMKAVGVTEEVIAFVRNISMHPETWLDFPLLPEDKESDDFDMSDDQKETRYDAVNKLACLLPSGISKASSRQRRVRASRFQPGVCYRLYPKVIHDVMPHYQLSEIL